MRRRTLASHPADRKPGRLTCPAPAVISRRLEGGVVAQLVERLVRNEEVRGSIPLNSTTALRFDQRLRGFSALLSPGPHASPHGRRRVTAIGLVDALDEFMEG